MVTSAFSPIFNLDKSMPNSKPVLSFLRVLIISKTKEKSKLLIESTKSSDKNLDNVSIVSVPLS